MYDEQGAQEDTRECEAMRKMFVGGLNRETTEDAFFNYFGQFGEMVDKVIITDMNTKQSRGFGFITYQQSDSVENVFSARPHVLDGKTLDVKRAMPREFNTAGAHSKTKKLFVGGFKGIDLQPEDLQQYVESRHPTNFGTIDKIDFLKDKETGQNKGFGFVECSSFDFADRLAISESSFLLKGRTLSIKKAEPKEGPGGPGMQGSGGRGGGMRGGRGGRGGGPMGGRGMRGGGGPGRGGRGGRGGGMGRGGFGGNDNYGGNYGGGNGSYSTAYPSYNMNDGYNQNQGANNYGQNYGQNPGYGQPNNTGGYDNSSYGQQSYNPMGGGYDQNNSYGNQSFNQGGYGNQAFGGGRGAARGGNNRYQPY